MHSQLVWSIIIKILKDSMCSAYHYIKHYHYTLTLGLVGTLSWFLSD